MEDKKKYPRSYVTTYCNKLHNVKTGRPIRHDCNTIPPAALRAEIDDDFPRAIEIMRRKKGYW